ncbi:MAG: glycoside hydrolase family 15 protein [Pseudonocardiaceae bacterium]
MTFTRSNGYASLGGYSLLADGRAGALVAADGAIDWFAAPRLDAAPVCAALLDPADGGTIALAPTVDYQATQRYVEGTMAVETTFRTAGGTVVVTDALTVGAASWLPWTELARRVETRSGEVPMRWQVRAGHRLSTARPWVHRRAEVPFVEAGDVQLAVVTDRIGAAEVTDEAVTGQFVARHGERALLAVIVTGGEPLRVPQAAEIHARIDLTVQRWRRWSANITYQGPHPDVVRRSALILKALTVAPRHGIAAALTTSLPEEIGGQRNFDYRFGWVRDSSFALDAMTRLGLSEEVHAALSWILHAVERTAPEVRSLYTLDGQPASAQMTSRSFVPGYRGSSPVNVGNSAASQTQLGAYGDVMDAVWHYSNHGGYLDAASATGLAAIADHTCDLWRGKDAGIWELGNDEHYTISKIGCWVALDRAVRLAEAGQLTSPHIGRWRCERAAVRAWIEQHCWSNTKQAFTFYAGTAELDAAVLLAARTGFLTADDPRLSSTIDAIRTELGAKGPLLYRYTGMAQHEGAFLACTFWLIEALTHAGRLDEASALLDEATAYAGDTGLYSEEVDPATGQLRGNLPQALTHLALIGAATAVAGAQRGGLPPRRITGEG